MSTFVSISPFCSPLHYSQYRHGAGASGRARIEEFHAPLFSTLFKISFQKDTDIKIRLIRTDVATVDVHRMLPGAADPKGFPGPGQTRLLNFVMTKDTGYWRITEMHNQDLVPLSPNIN